MKGTIYGNRLQRGTQVKKGWEPLLYICLKYLSVYEEFSEITRYSCSILMKMN